MLNSLRLRDSFVARWRVSRRIEIAPSDSGTTFFQSHEIIERIERLGRKLKDLHAKAGLTYGRSRRAFAKVESRQKCRLAADVVSNVKSYPRHHLRRNEAVPASVGDLNGFTLTAAKAEP